MVNSDRIEALLAQLDEYVAQLRELAGYPEPELVGDRVRLNATKYSLVVAIEICLDIAGHLVTREGWRRPRDYADTFAVLGEAGVIDTAFAATLGEMAHFRNRLVHLYAEVDAARIYQILQNDLSDFGRFEAAVLDYVAGRTRPKNS